MVLIRRSIILALVLSIIPRSQAAAGGPGRRELVQETRTAYIWAVGAWNFETCRILTDDLGAVPQYDDIAALCGLQSTDLINSGAAALFYVGSYDYQIDIIRELPEIVLTTAYQGGQVVIAAVDPLPDTTITRIEARINGIPAVCDSYSGRAGANGSLACTFDIYNIPSTITITASSSYGDTSPITTLRIGNASYSDDVFLDPVTKVIILGDNAYTQYSIFHDIPLAWGVIPGNIPAWARNSPAERLGTDHVYYYLAGQLLLNNLAAAPGCHNYGLAVMGYANICGVEASADLVYTYQNAYDTDIAAAAAAWGVPSGILKRIIAVESQFYPGALGIAGERGLYQLTRQGADTGLRWNGDLYFSVCSLYWDYCGRLGYDNLDAWQQDLLINHIILDPNNIDYLAAILRGNAFQVSRLINNVLRIETPGDHLTYIDLWSITIVNYHVGATVTAAALHQIEQLEQDLTWANYAAALNNLQYSGVQYLNMVTTGSKY